MRARKGEPKNKFIRKLFREEVLHLYDEASSFEDLLNRYGDKEIPYSIALVTGGYCGHVPTITGDVKRDRKDFIEGTNGIIVVRDSLIKPNEEGVILSGEKVVNYLIHLKHYSNAFVILMGDYDKRKDLSKDLHLTEARNRIIIPSEERVEQFEQKLSSYCITDILI